MRRVSCLLLVIAASCASKPRLPTPTQRELWLRTEREAIRNAWRPSSRRRMQVADSNIERLDELLSDNFESTQGAWCVVLLGEWFLVKSDIYGDDGERAVAADYFKSATQILNDVRSRAVYVQEKEAIAAAAKDGLMRVNAEPRPSNEKQRWLRSQRASIESALRLEPKRARIRVADDAIEDLDDLLQERFQSDLAVMVLIGEWYLVRASATADKADRRVAMDYFENVIAQVDTGTWPEGAAAAKDGLKRAHAAPSPEPQGILENP